MPDSQNVLIIGGGGREHALAWKIALKSGQLVTAVKLIHFEGMQYRTDIGDKSL